MSPSPGMVLAPERWSTLLLLSWLSGCPADPPGERIGPRETYLDFHAAVSAGEWDRAAQLLSPEAVGSFRALGAELAESVGSREEPLSFFLRGARADVAAPLGSVEVSRRDAERAWVRVRAGDCQSPDAGPGACLDREIALVFRAGRWWIQPDLPAGFAPAPAVVPAGAAEEVSP